MTSHLWSLLGSFQHSTRRDRFGEGTFDPSIYDFSSPCGIARYQSTIQHLFMLLKHGHEMESCWVEKLAGLITSSRQHYLFASQAVPALRHGSNAIPPIPCIRYLIDRTRDSAVNRILRGDVMPQRSNELRPLLAQAEPGEPEQSFTWSSGPAPSSFPQLDGANEQDAEASNRQIPPSPTINARAPSYETLPPNPPEYTAIAPSPPHYPNPPEYVAVAIAQSPHLNPTDPAATTRSSRSRSRVCVRVYEPEPTDGTDGTNGLYRTAQLSSQAAIIHCLSRLGRDELDADTRAIATFTGECLKDLFEGTRRVRDDALAVRWIGFTVARWGEESRVGEDEDGDR